MRRSRFSATIHTVLPRCAEGSHFAGLLTYALQELLLRVDPPSQFPSDRLSPVDLPVSTYSGGTVRDSHPVLLFSFSGHTPKKPQNGYQFVEKIVSQAKICVKTAKPPDTWQCPAVLH